MNKHLLIFGWFLGSFLYAQNIREDSIPEILPAEPGPHTSALFSARGDTIVYHPHAFIYEKDARLGALLNLIPGLHKKDGALYWNEKQIEVIVNGKSLLGGNGLLALLPCDAIQEIKAYNCTSDLTDITQRYDQEEDYKLDVILYKWATDSRWFTDYTAAYQSADKYLLELDALHFSPQNTFIAFANVNNINLSTTPKKFLNTQHEIDQFGRQQYAAAAYQRGWTTRQPLHPLSHKFHINSSLAHEDGWGNIDSFKDNFLENGQHDYQTIKSHHHSHLLHPFINSKITLHPSNNQEIIGKINLEYNRLEHIEHSDLAHFTQQPLSTSADFPTPSSASSQASAYFESSPGLLSLWHNQINQLTQSAIWNTDFSWSKFLSHKNKIEIGSNYEQTLRRDENTTYYQTEFKKQTEKEHLHQYYTQPDLKIRTEVYTFYKQWLNQHLLISGKYTFRYIYQKEKRNYFQATTPTVEHLDLQDFYDATNSYRSSNHIKEQLFQLALVGNFGRVSIRPQLEGTLSQERFLYQLGTKDTLIHRNRFIWTPQVRVRIHLRKLMKLQMEYTYNKTMPFLEQTIPWLDRTQPLCHTIGNPQLKSSRHHQAQVYFSLQLPRPQISIASIFTYRHTLRPISTFYTYDSIMTRYTGIPINARKASNQLKWYLNFHKQITPSWIFQSEMQASVEDREGFLIASTSYNHPDENKQKTQQILFSPQLSYKNRRFFEISLFGNLMFTKNSDEHNGARTDYFRNFDYGIQIKKEIGNFSIETLLRDIVYKGYTYSDINRHHLLWSAAACWYFSNKRGKLQLYFDDLLNNTITQEIQITPYQHLETRKDKLHQFIRFSLVYHLQH